MNKNTNHDIYKLIDKASDVYYNKHGLEADIFFINKSYYLQLLREKHDLRKSMGGIAKHRVDRSVLGFEIRLHRRKKIIDT
ncbi:MAG: hypothetical protein RIF34_11995 [Candidatus Kapaibacterium sp.]|jgi:hypothetical protein